MVGEFVVASEEPSRAVGMSLYATARLQDDDDVLMVTEVNLRRDKTWRTGSELRYTGSDCKR